MCALGASRCPSSVITLIHSETRIVLVWDPSFNKPRWKLPGGGIEPTDLTVIDAAIRECHEETGINLFREEITLFSCQPHKSRASNLYRCIARVTEEKLDTRSEFGSEGTHLIKVKAFWIEEVLRKVHLLPQHRPLIEEMFPSGRAA